MSVHPSLPSKLQGPRSPSFRRGRNNSVVATFPKDRLALGRIHVDLIICAEFAPAAPVSGYSMHPRLFDLSWGIARPHWYNNCEKEPCNAYRNWHTRAHTVTHTHTRTLPRTHASKHPHTRVYIYMYIPQCIQWLMTMYRISHHGDLVSCIFSSSFLLHII